MLLKYFYDKQLAQASYMVGCSATGEALIIDPARNIQPYLEAAAAEGLRITQVTETHIHADFVSGSRELAAKGARMYLSDMGDADWKYAFADDDTTLLHDGDTWMVGNIRIAVMHTPGHTPEHISFIITDTAGADRPMGIFTGDFVFVGDVGRPDLLEEAAGIADTKVKGARQQFASLQRLKDMPDYLQIWPGHGAGSACGKALGAIPSTTLGYEKLFNPAFQFENEDEFVEWLLDGQPEPPRYFAQMKKVNKLGSPLLTELVEPTQLNREALDQVLAEGDLVIDLRNREDFEAAFVPGTVSIPASSDQFSTYTGWFVDYGHPLYIIVPDAKSLDRIVSGLRAIGVDYIGGYGLPSVVEAGQHIDLPHVDANEVAQHPSDWLLIDVRGKSEFDELHIKNAQHIPLGFLPQYVDQLPRDKAILLQCASGYRSQIATSLLKRHGFEQVSNLADSKDNWSKILPTEGA